MVSPTSHHEQSLPGNATGSTPAETPPASAEPAAEPKPFLCRKPVRITIYLCFAVLFAAMLTGRYLPGYLDPTFEKHIQSKKVMVGMTRQQVLKAWGSPYTMNVSYTKDGVRREEWIFEDWIDAKTVKHRYLYFEEDALVGGWY
jgi:hypothetical protein